jgi:hypothetical protein
MSTKRILTSAIDAGSSEGVIYNKYAGAQKNIEVGSNLKPIKLSETSWTLDATTARRVGKGAQVFIYNNSSTVYTVRFGSTSSVTSGAVADIDANGQATLPCKANDWTRVSSGTLDWMIANNASLLVYLLIDDTEIRT